MKQLKYFINKKTVLLTAVFCLPLFLSAQKEPKKNNITIDFGSGLNFSLNHGDYQFNLGGFIQPTFVNEKTTGLDAKNKFNSKRSFLQFSGKAIKEKVSFLVQLDYSKSAPLMDAWVAYHPHKSTTITVGQKQSFLNNREMIFREDKLQLTSRSFLSKNLSNTGREFGVFIKSKFGNSFGIAPMFAVTSGDGRNSFGNSSKDADLGGLKIGGRLDVYPLGYFKEGNDNLTTDLGREETLKIVVGSAFSKNNGVSDSKGEGHGNFLLYNANGSHNLPDYSQIYIDFLLKYQGFSVLGEYANTSASNLNKTYTDKDGKELLIPTQISEYLFLGNSFNIQTGYVTKKGFSFDARYESTTPEFKTNGNSLLKDSSAFSLGISKYFDNNNLKIQTSYTNRSIASGNKMSQIEVLVQIAF